MAAPEPLIIHMEATDSTNREAFRLLKQLPAAEGTVILAKDQTAGRGQGQSSWESKPGENLTFSVILRPVFLPPASQFLLNQALALAVRDGIALLLPPGEPVLIKWPNDICCKNRKVAGTLIENQIMGSQRKVSVAGIGININQERFSPEAPLAISLKTIAGKPYELNTAFQLVYDSIMKWYRVLREKNNALISETYLAHLLGLEETRRFSDKNGIFSGVIKGIDEFGRILIQLSDGRQMRYDIKEISFLF